MAFDNTQLTNASGYDVNNMKFTKPKDGSIPNSTVAFKRIAIGTRNPDGSLGELVIPTPRVYSYGLSPSTNMQTGKVDGYTLALCLHNRDSPTAEEKEWVETFDRIVDHIKKYLLDNRDSFGKYELESSDLKKLSPLYYKKDKGKIVDGAGPVLYAKVMQNKKNETISTPFSNEKGLDIDPMILMNKPCYATAAIKIESIFIGAKISLQVKVYEAEVKMIDNAPRRLLRRPVANDEVVMESSKSSFSKNSVNDDSEDDDNQSIKADDDSEDDEQKVEAAKPAVSEPVVVEQPAQAAVSTAKTATRRVQRKA
jgi:hypothetical protein